MANWQAVRMILSAWSDHLEESFYKKNVHFKNICLFVKTSCPHAENINETDANILNQVQSSGYGF